MVKSKVMVLSQAQSSLSGEGSLVVMLDRLSDLEEVAAPLEVEGHWEAPGVRGCTLCGTPPTG